MPDPEFDLEWFTESVDAVCIRSDDFDPSDVRSTTELLSGADVDRFCRALREIGRNSNRHRAVNRNAAGIEEQGAMSHLVNCREVVTHQQHRSPLVGCHVTHFSQAFLLEFVVPHGENLIDYEYITFEMCSDRKRKAYIHPRAISFHRHIEEPLDPCKRHDLIELALDIRSAHPEDGTIE